MRPSPQGRGTRYDGLDAVRAFAMLLGVAYHAAYAWFPDVARWYFVADQSPLPSLVFFVGFAHAWRMQLFFALSGFFAHLVFERRGPAAFLKDRAHRLLLPLIVALPFTLLADWGTRVASKRQGLMSALYEPGDAFRFIPMHLWFLIYLFSFCLVASALPSVAWPRKLFERALAFPPVLMLFALPAYKAFEFHPENKPDQFFWPMPFEWLHYGAFFLFGWLLWSAREHVARFKRFAPVFLLGGLVLGRHIYDGPLQWQPEGQMQAAFVAWLITFGALGLAFFAPQRAADAEPSRAAQGLRFLTEASYWVYLAHYPVILVLQLCFASTPLDGRLEYGLTVCGTAALLLALYAVGVRRTKWARTLGISH